MNSGEQCAWREWLWQQRLQLTAPAVGIFKIAAGHHENSQMRRLLAHRARERETVESRHVEISDDEFERLRFSEENFQRGARVIARDYFAAGNATQNFRGQREDGRVVIHHEPAMFIGIHVAS